MGLAIPAAAGSGSTYTTPAGQAALTASLVPLIQACMVRAWRRASLPARVLTAGRRPQGYPNLLFWMIGNEVEDPPNQGYGAARAAASRRARADARALLQAPCSRT